MPNASALSQTDGTGQRWSLAMMASADLVQRKGLGLALCRSDLPNGPYHTRWGLLVDWRHGYFRRKPAAAHQRAAPITITATGGPTAHSTCDRTMPLIRSRTNSSSKSSFVRGSLVTGLDHPSA